MRLEDALLYAVFDAARLPGSDIPALCRAAIGAGADIIGIKSGDRAADAGLLVAVGTVCREEDAIFAVWHDPSIVEQAGAGAVHLSGADASVGGARAYVGMDRLVGMSTYTLEEAVLAAEVGADFIVHMAGEACVPVFAQLSRSGISALFAGGLKSLDEARAVVGRGVFRVCLEIGSEGDADAKAIAEYSRLFGRVV